MFGSLKKSFSENAVGNFKEKSLRVKLTDHGLKEETGSEACSYLPRVILIRPSALTVMRLSSPGFTVVEAGPSRQGAAIEGARLPQKINQRDDATE